MTYIFRSSGVNATGDPGPSSNEYSSSVLHGDDASSRTRISEVPSSFCTTAARTAKALSLSQALTSPGFCVSSRLVPFLRSKR